MFDSLAVDSEGHVCVATLITGAVSDIWPDGSRVDQYVLPDMMVTNVCFGGRDLRTAYATLSMGGTLVSFEVAASRTAAAIFESVTLARRLLRHQHAGASELPWNVLHLSATRPWRTLPSPHSGRAASAGT
jgi:hypothetical protein